MTPQRFPGQTITRRRFLRQTLLGAAVTATIPVFLQKTFAAMESAAAASPVQTPTGRDANILVILQMAGGNDGLNTVVPYEDHLYYRARPALGVRQADVLPLAEGLGLHPALKGLRGLYDDGALGVIRGVGYPNPNRSHFRSMEIWQTASDASVIEKHGWLGRYFDHACSGADPAVGVAIANAAPQAFSAEEPRGITFNNPRQYRWAARGLDAEADALYAQFNEVEDADSLDGKGGGTIGTLGERVTSGLSARDFLQRTAVHASRTSAEVLAITRKPAPVTALYPRSALGNSLNTVARMIAGGMSTRAYYLSQGGYDTHRDQTGSHARLLGDLGDSLQAFVRDLKAQGNFERVTVMTFSEFGRRVEENGSLGTDHGAAGPMFFIGGGVKPGLYGKQPSLSDLNRGDLKFNVDFRSLYATVLEKCLGVESAPILGRKFPLVAVI